MYNPSVAYVGPDGATRSLANEFLEKYGRPARPSEFVTGYPGPTNVSGHNPDSNGITHGVDIFAGPGNVPFADMRWAADTLCDRARAGDGRALYYIYADQIASPATNWYFSGSGWGHLDHLHASIWDGYWGGPCGLPASVYNDISPWGVLNLIPQGSKPTPVPEGQFMNLPYDDQVEIRDNLRKLVHMTAFIKESVKPINLSGNRTISTRQALAVAMRNAEAAAANTAPIHRTGGDVSLRQELANTFNKVSDLEPIVVDIAEAVKVENVDLNLDKV